MSDEKRMQLLKLSLNVFGAIFIVGIYLMMNWVWPSGWGWEPRQPEYEQMIMGVYATLGIFLVRAAKDPLANLSLIWFPIWSSAVHAAIMAVQAIMDVTERANLLGDVSALFLVAIVLWYLLPKGASASN
jgi:sterol desaturase/sphingolipid hydroxylase (fatty acid hydroxylase superfamily)